VKELTMKRATGICFAAFVGILMMAVSAQAQMPMAMQPNSDTLVVISTGEASAVPDYCMVLFNLEASGDSMAGITADLKTNAEKAKSILGALDVPGIKVETGGMTIAAAGADMTSMFGSLGAEKPKGYTAKTTISISFSIAGMETQDIMAKLDAAIQSAETDAGLTLGKFGFGVTGKEQLEQQALDNAIKNSGVEAEKLAKAGGKTLDGISSFMTFDLAGIMGGMFGGMGPLKGVMEAMFSANKLSDSPTSVSVSASIFASYKIK
jgi:uncharacterized protein YggE